MGEEELAVVLASRTRHQLNGWRSTDGVTQACTVGLVRCRSGVQCLGIPVRGLALPGQCSILELTTSGQLTTIKV